MSSFVTQTSRQHDFSTRSIQPRHSAKSTFKQTWITLHLTTTANTFVRYIIIVFLAFQTQLTVHAENVMQKVSPLDGAVDDAFGCSVSIDSIDENVLIGAFRAKDDKGSAYIFENINGIWTQTTNLSANDSEKSDNFGVSVSVHNGYALIGAYQDDNQNGDNAGSAYIFVKTSNGTWKQETKLLPDDGAANDRFGHKVSIYNNYALIASRFSEAAYIFERLNGTWRQMAKLFPQDASSVIWWGYSASLYHKYALIGVNDPNGYAVMFERINGTWTETATLTPKNRSISTNERFGLSVSIYNESALIGAPIFHSSSSSAYVFDKVNGNWTETAKLTPTDGGFDDMFGQSVSMYDQFALIGAVGDNDKGDDSGSAYVFKRTNITTWTQTAKLTSNEGSWNNIFGWSVSIHSKYAVVGEPTSTSHLQSPGEAYITRNYDSCDGLVNSTDYYLVDYRWTDCTLPPTAAPTTAPIAAPSSSPTALTATPSSAPTLSPSGAPTDLPSAAPSESPFATPTLAPITDPTAAPSQAPSLTPSLAPTIPPSAAPSLTPTIAPSVSPTAKPTPGPTESPIECPYNTFQVNTTSECYMCNAHDIGYECQGGSMVKVEYGYWVSAYHDSKHQYSTALSPLHSINNSFSIMELRCPPGKCCANHTGCDYFNASKHPSKWLCAAKRNVSSVTCSRCEDGHSELLGSATCGDCNQTNYMLLSLLFIMALIFTLFLLFILSRPSQLLLNITSGNKEINWRKLMVYDSQSLMIVLIFKIYLYYYQGLSQLLFIKNITPASQFERTVLSLFDFDLSLLSVSSQNGLCFIAGIQSGIYELLIAYIWYVFIAMNVIIVAVISRCFCQGRPNTSCKPYVQIGCIHIILMTAGPLLSTSFKFLTCFKYDIDGRYYHFYDADIACYEYIWFFAGLLPVVMLCGVLVRLWFIIYKQDASQREKESNPYWSLTKRFNSNMWHWEFVLFIRRLGIAALTSFYGLADKMSSILLASFIIFIFALQTSFTPFKHHRANMIESMCLFATASIVVALIVMGEDTIAMSWYLTFLIMAPLAIICIIIVDIVYKWCTFQDLHVDKETDSYKQIKQRWLGKDEAIHPNANEIEMQLQITSHDTTRTIQQQIEEADTVQQLMPIINTINITDLKKMLLQYCDDSERITRAKTTTFNDEDADPMVGMDQNMVYFKDGKHISDSADAYDMQLSDDSEEEKDELIYKEVKLVSEQHIVLELYHTLDTYLKYKPDPQGKGIMVERMKRNEYGTELYVKYGFNESEEWFVDGIDGNKVSNKAKKDIDQILRQIEVKNGYEVVFKTKKKSNKNVSKKVKQIKHAKDWADQSQHLLDSLDDGQALQSDQDETYGKRTGSYTKEPKSYEATPFSTRRLPIPTLTKYKSTPL